MSMWALAMFVYAITDSIVAVVFWREGNMLSLLWAFLAGACVIWAAVLQGATWRTEKNTGAGR